MSRKLCWIIAVSAAAAGATPLASALAARGTAPRALPKGDLVVSFSGTGGGSYRFHQPPLGGDGSACRVADTSYIAIDSYRWSYRFVLPPGGGSSDAPSTLAGGGQLSGTQQLLQCAGAAAVTSTCTQALRAPLSSNSADLAYPGVTVGASGRFVTVGAVGELVRSTPQPICDGLSVRVGNLVEGFSQLQASVSFPRALLASTGDAVRRFTIAGSGLYRGVTLSGACDSASCAVSSCTDGSGGVGAPSACSFNESYSGRIEVRVVR
jgi:hypothetical protein